MKYPHEETAAKIIGAIVLALIVVVLYMIVTLGLQIPTSLMRLQDILHPPPTISEEEKMGILQALPRESAALTEEAKKETLRSLPRSGSGVSESSKFELMQRLQGQ